MAVFRDTFKERLMENRLIEVGDVVICDSVHNKNYNPSISIGGKYIVLKTGYVLTLMNDDGVIDTYYAFNFRRLVD